jgi:putative NIF3 family GTP cyclohydrolase 1 type 2
MSKRPTHAAVAQFVSTILPPKPNDVQLLYHVPRNPKYDAETARVDQIVLSVTPTPGVYETIGFEAASTTSTVLRTALPRPPRTLCFLHRPFNLDRRRVKRGTLVLASHTSFDELLTVGWNEALAKRLKMDISESVCVQGYKGDPERRIGIIGRVSVPRGVLESRIKREMGTVEAAFEGTSEDIHVMAIMNAFNTGEVNRVLEMAQERGWIQAGENSGRNVLYLTGQPRESGLFAAREAGMSVVCVGHRSAEEWGIKYLASNLRTAFADLSVKEVYEEEVTPQRTN